MTGSATRAASEPPAFEPAASAEQILSPDAPLVVAGRSVVVREYNYAESLEAASLGAALIADIAATLAGAQVRYDRVRPLFAKHRRAVVALIALATGTDQEWIGGLPRAQGELLQNTWFAVNCGFFVHEAAVILLEDRRLANRSTGPTSSSASPTPGSEGTTPSSAGPGAS